MTNRSDDGWKWLARKRSERSDEYTALCDRVYAKQKRSTRAGKRHRWSVTKCLEPEGYHEKPLPIRWWCRDCGVEKWTVPMSNIGAEIRYSHGRPWAGDCGVLTDGRGETDD